MDNPLFYALCIVLYVVSCFAWYNTGCTITANRFNTQLTKELLEIEKLIQKEQEEIRRKMEEL